ncbi:DPY30/SDC1 family protein [Aspergillus clavatus NRRL 1]|uniref:COMPASS complex subunit Sdc1, putative n=1 Tax=Aspergillus clavatus (strain ATCC 1007 / CBS 513.65 / DSM 816 / NCTC 3887 / NRRL 1 / QM 1276 / 107) TaxID=344612 RepID=A1CDL1_ASPCL|nr:COMPASS complex subunit Sdc1, putative [Aspergillus clavatus NRRL 1]EAW11938.1 COMPASS complex subunit Sdc1, putative [Aspergillus clavatus NRRL 1]
MGNGATPTSNTGAANTPRAESNTPAAQTRPGGAPARVYMNEKIVPYLLEGMKSIVKEQPSDPLRALGEFLIQKSNEVEGGAAGPNKSPE